MNLTVGVMNGKGSVDDITVYLNLYAEDDISGTLQPFHQTPTKPHNSTTATHTHTDLSSIAVRPNFSVYMSILYQMIKEQSLPLFINYRKLCYD